MKSEYLNEDQLLNWLKVNLEPRIYKVSNDLSRHDCMLKGVNNVCVELKSRRTHYDSLLIEKDKYDHLVKFKQAYYINYTPKGIISFDIHKLNPVWETTYQPATTYFNNNNMIQKLTYYIPIELGKNLLLTINK